jgi:hypothetical protein
MVFSKGSKAFNLGSPIFLQISYKPNFLYTFNSMAGKAHIQRAEGHGISTAALRMTGKSQAL